MRKVVAVSGGVISTFWLFVFMASLVAIKPSGPLPEAPDFNRDWTPHKFEEKPLPPKRKTPDKKEIEQKLTQPKYGFNDLPKNNTDGLPLPEGEEKMPTIWNWHDPIDGRLLPPGIGEPQGTSEESAAAMPVAQIPPMYPRELAQQGIQGWVKLRFDVNEQGEPINIAVLDAKPKNVFNRAAVASIAKWRYRPAMVDGKTVRSLAQEIVLDFKLEN